MNVGLLNEVPGGPDLIAWFDGVIPSFHDTEIVGLALERKNSSCCLKVHGFRTTPDLDERGHFITIKHVIITFQFNQVDQLELSDFNHQNVIDGLKLSRQSNGNFLLEMEPCYGLWGKIEASNLQISLEPGKPEGSVYAQWPPLA
jgi:hypothetical protein